ncbi:MAG: YCF48-related protein [Bacteroidales bacterium]
MKKFTTLVVILAAGFIFAMTTIAQSNWQSQTSGVMFDLQAVDFITEEEGIAVGMMGTVLRTTDGGETWNIVDLGIDNWFNDVQFIDQDRVIIGGDQGIVLYSNDGGDNWDIVQESGQGYNIYGLSVDPVSGHGIAGGSGNTIIWTEDFGLTWEYIEGGFMNNYYCAHMPNGDFGTVIGRNAVFQPLAGYTMDGGQTWDGQPYYPTVNNVGYESTTQACYFFDENNGYTVGTVWNGDGFLTTAPNWNSQQWNAIMFEGAMLFGIDFLDASYGVVVGGDYNITTSIFETYDGGTNWEAATVQSDGNTMLDVALVGNTGYAVGTFGEIIKKVPETIDESWQTIATPVMFDLKAIDFANQEVGVAVGMMGTILRTTDGGTTWNTIDLGIDNWFNDVQFIDQQRAIICGDQGIILYSTDSGENWDIVQESGQGYNIYGISVDPASGNGIAGGSGNTIIWTEDFGQTWEYIEGGFMNDYHCAFMANEDFGTVIGRNAVFQPLAGYTMDGGETWDGQPYYPTMNNIGYESTTYDCYFFDENTGYTVGTVWNGDGFITTAPNWNSQQWNAIMLEGAMLFGIDFLDDTYGVVVGGDYNATTNIFETTDGGLTWEPVEVSSDGNTMLDVCLIGNVGYAVGTFGEILKINRSGSNTGSGILHGFFRDAETNLSVDHAMVNVLNTSYVGSPCESIFGARYNISLPVGTYTIQCEAEGYETVVADIEVIDGQNTNYTFYLQPVDNITGIRESEVKTQISPNPASDVVMIESSENIRQIFVMNQAGQVVMKTEANSTHVQMNISSLHDGIFVLKILTDRGVSQQKLIIR